LSLRARVILCEGAHLVDQYPHAARVNVFGDPSPSHLCPAHPDVRQYAAAIIEDMFKNYQPEAVEICQFNFGMGDWYPEGGYGAQHLRSMILVANWCFCSACQQRGSDSGVDVDTVRRTVLDHWDSLDAPRFMDRVVEEIDRSPSLVEYGSVRRKTVS